MTKEAYLKAKEIYEELHKWKTLYGITLKPYQKYCLVKKILWITNCDHTEAIMCDSGLTQLIREYSEKKIDELEKELKEL